MQTLSGQLLLAQQDGSWIDRILGLRTVHWSDPSAGVGFEYVLPAWVWALVFVSALLFAGWSYHRLLGGRVLRMMLAFLRAVTLVVLLILLAGPTLVLPRETVEPDWLLVLVDRSGSMRVRDLVDAQSGEPINRDTALRRALEAQSAVFSDEGLGKDRRVTWLGFGASAYPIASPVDTPDMPEPSDLATSIRTAIEQALRLPAGKPVSGVVLISDGQTPQDTGQALVQRLKHQGVGVYTVAVGAAQPPLDLAIGQAQSPRRAFINDTAPVSVTVDQLGGDALNRAQIVLTLTDEADGRVLDQKPLDEALPNEPVKLHGKSSQIGTARWRVSVEHKPAPGQAPLRELVTDNNTRVVEVEIIDRPIRVLYIEGYPRWEFRYLKNLLIREKSISSSTALLSADRAFAQEGDIPITRPPATAKEMDAYDVVIVGDVPSGYFSAKQLSLLRDHVSVGGAGLIWIGGEVSTPRSYAGTPLADLLPMRRPGDVKRAGDISSRFYVQPTALAQSLNVLQLGGVGSDAQQTDAWPDDLPPLRWAQDLGPLKPTADVLAEVSTENSDRQAPALVRLRYGAGQSLYVGTDEAWRWRYGRGELYFERYWVQLVRMLGRARIQADADRARLSVSQRIVEAQQAVVVELSLSDPSLIARGLVRVGVAVRSALDPTAPPVEELVLLPIGDANNPNDTGAGRTSYRTVWRPGVTGSLVLMVSDPAFEGLGLTETVRVQAADDEMRNPQSDHGRLSALAEQTGGAVVALDELDRLLKLVPNRARITPADIREPLWDSALSLIVVLTLLSLEWVLRRAIRLT